jgi:hypothetical protein
MKELESKILKDLFESVDGLYPFTFYSRYKIEPDVMFKFIDRFLKRKFILFSQDKLYMTELGRMYAQKVLFFRKRVSNTYGNIPTSFLENKLKINEPYLPELYYLSQNILNNEGID